MKNTCQDCLCRDCPIDCPSPCRALYPCDAPVTKCPERAPAKRPIIMPLETVVSFSKIKRMARAHHCYTLDDEDYRFAANMSLKGHKVTADLLIKWHKGYLEERFGDCAEAQANDRNHY